MTLKQLEKEIEAIKLRNKRVETEKAWETSWARKFLISTFTYMVISVFFLFAGVINPFINAIVPALGFILSTLSLPYIKKLWLKYIQKNY